MVPVICTPYLTQNLNITLLMFWCRSQVYNYAIRYYSM
jgi:hypothetical protein